MVKAFLEIVNLKADVITASGCSIDDGCNGCDLGCTSDAVQMGGDV